MQRNTGYEAVQGGAVGPVVSHGLSWGPIDLCGVEGST